MNVKLVESLAQIIQSLTPEEQDLLNERLNYQKLSQTKQQKLEQLREKIFARREGEPFNPPLDQYIQSTRDERTAEQDELLSGCFGEPSQPLQL
ncbi:MAG: hypothetical protein RMY34_20935 [Aulosira sp. DedQUE10]|nr:hypothetical protein [Aulosira sp. DedQUE10]